jgi:hypothetical protein
MQFSILRIGRGEFAADGRKNDIQVNHPSVSRAHLEVFIDAERQIFVTDLSSSNGSFVNGKPIEGTCLLREGDELILGRSEPLNWKGWVTMAAPSSAVGPISTAEDDSAFSVTGFSQTRKKNTVPYLIAACIALLVIGCTLVFLFRDSLFPGAQEPLSRDLAAKLSFQELQQQAKSHASVFEIDDSARLITNDSVKVILLVADGHLSEVLRDESTPVDTNPPAQEGNTNINPTVAKTPSTPATPTKRNSTVVKAPPASTGNQAQNSTPGSAPAPAASAASGSTITLDANPGETIAMIHARAKSQCITVDKADIQKACGVRNETEPLKVKKRISVHCEN